MRPAEALDWVILAAPDSKRVRLMQAARAGLGLPPAHVVAWRDWLRKPETLTAHWRKPCRFKLEPPNDDEFAQQQLRQNGCRLLQCDPLPNAVELRAWRLEKRFVAPALAGSFEASSPPKGGTTNAVSTALDPLLRPEPGELLAMDVWYAGFADSLRRIETLLAEHPQVQTVNAPAEILLMADKLACQQHLHTRQIPTPLLLGPVQSYGHLRDLLDHHGLDRVYLKARYGSSAAGVVAYRRNRRGQEQATSSAHLTDGRLINRKRLRSYHAPAEIQTLIDLIARQQAYAEAWITKPRIGNGHFDLRVLTLGGVAAHRVARIGERAMTNLHLDNRRSEVSALLDADDCAVLEHTAEQAAAAFPRSHVIGFDVVVNQRQAQVLEANAFGDWLPGLLWQGDDTYTAQLRGWLLP